MSGHHTDPETGYVFLRNRYYDPNTGRFLSVDPAVAVTRAPYAYGDDNPLNETDLDGQAANWTPAHIFESTDLDLRFGENYPIYLRHFVEDRMKRNGTWNDWRMPMLLAIALTVGNADGKSEFIPQVTRNGRVLGRS